MILTDPTQQPEDTDADTVFRYAFARLPTIRQHESVRIIETEFVNAGQSVVRFQARLSDDGHDVLISAARLRLIEEKWKIWPSPLSDWIIPGMENRIFFDVFTELRYDWTAGADAFCMR